MCDAMPEVNPIMVDSLWCWRHGKGQPLQVTAVEDDRVRVNHKGCMGKRLFLELCQPLPPVCPDDVANTDLKGDV